MAWITPKTNWTKTDKFSITDYNRIKNNLLHINDMLNEMFPEKAQPLDLGDDKTYSGNYYASEFNAFENALESFTRVGSSVNIGEKKTFYGNSLFIDSQELNRIESCSLRWYNFEPPRVKAISIQPNAAILRIGDSATFNVVVNPTNADDKEDYVVTSSNPSIVSVVKNGMQFIANSVSEGDATITVSIGSVSVTVNVQVQAPQVTQIICSEKSITLNKGESRTIDLTFLPEDALNKKDWTVTTNNDGVAVLKLNDNKLQISWNKSSSKSTITISCGDVSQKILATTSEGTDAFYIATGCKLSPTAQNIFRCIYFNPINTVYVNKNYAGKYVRTLIYVASEPMINRSDLRRYTKFNYDKTMCSVQWEGDVQWAYVGEFIINGLKAGETTIIISYLELSCELKVIFVDS